MITSVSIPEDLQPYVMAYRESGGKFSELVCKLLRVHFGTLAMNDPALVSALTTDLKNQLETLQDSVVQISERIDSLNTLKAEAKQHQEKRLSELSTLIDQQYDDRGEYADIRTWVRECGGKDAFTRAMKTRCGVIATKGGVSVEVAKAAILAELPELGGYL